MTYWWLSFADPQRAAGTQFLGVAIVPAADFISAVMTAGLNGCNPGGEVRGNQYIADDCGVEPPAEYVGRLLTKDEASALDEKMHDLYPREARPTGH